MLFHMYTKLIIPILQLYQLAFECHRPYLCMYYALLCTARFVHEQWDNCSKSNPFCSPLPEYFTNIVLLCITRFVHERRDNCSKSNPFHSCNSLLDSRGPLNHFLGSCRPRIPFLRRCICGPFVFSDMCNLQCWYSLDYAFEIRPFLFQMIEI